ncbi:MAG: LysR substrate-binding domain-containing protein [Pseudomonadota bacterium]
MTRATSPPRFGPERMTQLASAADDLMLLVEIIDAGGFSAASARTGVPKSRLSRRIAGLEERLGVNLLLRNSRHFEVTEIGQQLYQHGNTIRAEMAAAVSLAQDSQGEQFGSLRIACPIALASFIVGRVAAEFAMAHPHVRISLSTTKGTPESLPDHYDLVLMPAAHRLPDSDMIMQRVGLTHYALVATPNVAEAAGHPCDPDALRGCDAIGWGALDDTSRWQLHGPDGRQAEVDLRIRFSSDNLMVIREAALAGLGIARLAPTFCRQEIEQGKLCIVMPGWAPPPMSIYALYPSRRHVSNVGKLFLAALTLQFNQAFAS